MVRQSGAAGGPGPRACRLAEPAGGAGAHTDGPAPRRPLRRRPVMPIKTKRWDDPREADDGFRLLTCRYRPRALPKKDETWDSWCKDLGPSKELHADFYGKHGEPIGWEEYQRR